MILIEITPSKQPQRSFFVAATVDGFTPQGNGSHRNHFFEAATAQLVRGSHNRWIHCTGAAILIEIDPSKQPQRSSFEAVTTDVVTAQGNVSHRNHSFEPATAQLFSGSDNRRIHGTGQGFSSKSFFRGSHGAARSRQPQSMDSLHSSMIPIEIAPFKQPQRSCFEAATIDGVTPQRNDSHRNRSFEAATAQLLQGNHNQWIHCTGQ